ncbi:MAG TPA: hypothetical protein VIH52_01220 [Candidatus Nanoarchaeia archaeon]|nr:hypothetical protein [uncultured archaeon]
MITSKTKTILLVIIFAIAFAFVEASVVVYLRHLLGAGFNPPQVSKGQILFLIPGIAFLDPKTAVSVIRESEILRIEQFREAATLVILASVAFLTAKNWWQRLAYFLLAFGVWDIFYYMFLRLTIGWPRSLADLDIFFLLPFPWVGPVITPVAISALLILTSFIILKRKD